MMRSAQALALGLALAVAWWFTDALGPFALAALWFGGPFALGWVVGEWVAPRHRRLGRVVLVVDGLALLLYAGLAHTLPFVSGSPFDGVLSLAVAPVQVFALVVAVLVTPPVDESGTSLSAKVEPPP